jgi:hypothetical protein
MIRRVLKILALLFLIANLGFAMLTFAAYLRYTNRDHYYNETFRVTSAGVTGRMGGQPYLEGEISYAKEVFTDQSAPAMSASDYLKAFPIGSEIPVKYNPNLTGLLVQSQSMRVLKRDWNFGDDLALIKLHIIYLAAPFIIISFSMRFTQT